MNLKEIRIQKGFSQKTVADGLECSPTVYSRYETGERQPSIDVLLKLSAFFNVSVDYLIGNQDITIPCLSPFEIELILAAREADERAREDALYLLQKHNVSIQK